MTDIENSARLIHSKAPDVKAKIAVMLGSGLGAVADLMKEEITVPYADLPGFPQPTVASHEGSLRIGYVGDTPAYFLKGRQHLYEGKGTDGIKTVIRTLKRCGIEILVLTNAAGSLMPEYGPGAVVAIRDHINLSGHNPLTGPNEDELGPRFPDMGNCWDRELRAKLADCAGAEDIDLGEGVYAYFAGPTFETPAEIKMAGTLGADLVGMSTVPENILATHCGLKCVGISAVTNMAAGMSDEILSHEHTMDNAKKAEGHMALLLKVFLQSMG